MLRKYKAKSFRPQQRINVFSNHDLIKLIFVLFRCLPRNSSALLKASSPLQVLIVNLAEARAKNNLFAKYTRQLDADNKYTFLAASSLLLFLRSQPRDVGSLSRSITPRALGIHTKLHPNHQPPHRISFLSARSGFQSVFQE